MSKGYKTVGKLLLWGVFLTIVGLAIWLLYISLDPNRTTKVVVEWTTASELDTVGYNLYRGENPSGEFIKVNKELIPSSGDALAGGDYRFIDPLVKPGKIYYYMLEDVDSLGSTQRNGPITIKTETYRWLEIVLVTALLSVAILGMVILGFRSKNL